MDNITFISKKLCTGCAACYYACPVKCISMIKDDEGFLFPSLFDSHKCIKCGVCLSCCPVQAPVDILNPIAAYAMQRVGKEKARKSSSGGMAALLTEKILDASGIVYGCIMDEKMQVKHVRVSNRDDADRFLGSKYVQSDFTSVYKTVKDDCESGKEVMVIGTPCQIAGLRNFLKKDYENLLLVDLICHGVPSQWLFDCYIEWLKSRRPGNRIISYTFRDQFNKNWGEGYYAKIVTADEDIIVKATRDPYYSAFMYAETFRESCYHCQYAQPGRVADITIGDYWGVRKMHPQLLPYCPEGISAVLAVTRKGKSFIESLSSKAIVVDSATEKIVAGNGSLICPAKKPRIRDIYYRCVNKWGFSWAAGALHLSGKYYLNLFKEAIPHNVKEKIKRRIGRY